MVEEREGKDERRIKYNRIVSTSEQANLTHLFPLSHRSLLLPQHIIHRIHPHPYSHSITISSSRRLFLSPELQEPQYPFIPEFTLLPISFLLLQLLSPIIINTQSKRPRSRERVKERQTYIQLNRYKKEILI
jgi:hypothetical protein